MGFTGLVVAHGPDFVVSPEFPPADAQELIDTAVHIEVDAGDVQLG